MSRLLPCRRALGGAVLLGAFLASALPATAGERYFGMIFGSQSAPWRARYTHTFGAVVKATGEGPDWNSYELELYTASWLPVTGVVRPLAPCPEPGRSFTLPETLALALGSGQKIQQWGPYEIRTVSFARSLRRLAELDSGRIRYRAITGLERGTTRNCYHAIADLDPKLTRWNLPEYDAGFVNTEKIVLDFYRNGVYLSPQTDQGWLNTRLGLDSIPLCRRRIDPRTPICPNDFWREVLASPPPPLPLVPRAHLVVPAGRSLRTPAEGVLGASAMPLTP